MADHPRACGEKLCRPAIVALDLGSPPRMRGKGNPANASIRLSRITPAHAGKRDTKGEGFTTDKDHPRACGEKAGCPKPPEKRKGSPPRMRGKATVFKSKTYGLGITPAHAGKSFFVPHGALSKSGSPPRMRGKDDDSRGTVCQLGITPAHAGKRLWCAKWCVLCGDHPRACGEKMVSMSWTSYNEGSPPRMRGKGGVSCPCGQGVGITPAHAGKSARCASGDVPLRDHPRACGEKMASSSYMPPSAGITPAHAGKRLAAAADTAAASDHPRACGEKTKKIP